jgi:hypothetical protein
MKSQDDLHDLVKTLTPAEKRYFKVATTKGDSKSNPLKLFEALDSLEEYDDERLKKKLKGETLLKYLSAEKATLYEAIMRAMRAYHADKSVDTRIFELMQEEVFLRGKGLNELRAATLTRAEALARKYEKFTYLLEILLAQKDLITEFEEKSLSDTIAVKLEEIEQVSAQQALDARLNIINAEIFVLLRSGADMKNESNRNHLESLINEVRSFGFRLGSSFRLQVGYHSTMSNYFNCIADRKSCFEHTATQLALYEANPEMILEESQGYKTTLANYLTRAHAWRDYSRFEELLKTLKGLPTDSFYAEGEVFQNVNFIEHLYYINNGRFEEAEQLVPVIQVGLVTYARKINKSRVLSFKYNILVMYFIMHKFKEAKQWSESIMEENTDIRQDMQTANRILYPIICYELGKFDILENITRASYRYLLSQQRLHDFERLVIRYLQAMPFNANEKDFEEKLSEFEQELEILKSAPGFHRSYGIDEVDLWIKFKRNGKLMRELL